MLLNCSNCRTPLQAPTRAHSIRCAVCQSITTVASASASVSPSYAQPSPHGRKRAVICGISYRSSRHELAGCVNDAKCMRYLLINKFRYPPDSILMLSEEETDPHRIPTKHNIRLAMCWLVSGCQPGDSLVFHYAGHGSRQRNYNGDEVGGYDETLCPLDFETQGMIVDDEINAAIVKPLPHGVKLHAIIDACQSGTVLDLPYHCRVNSTGKHVWEDRRPQSGTWKGSNGGEVIAFSGCDDGQTSADVPVSSLYLFRFSPLFFEALSNNTSTGVMTYCFIQAIERGQANTYGIMLSSMRAAIQSIAKDLAGGGVFTSFVNMVVNGGSVSRALSQEPQLTASEPFDLYEKPFSL